MTRTIGELMTDAGDRARDPKPSEYAYEAAPCGFVVACRWHEARFQWFLGRPAQYAKGWTEISAEEAAAHLAGNCPAAPEYDTRRYRK